MTTVADAIADVRRSAFGPMPDTINLIGLNYAAGDDEVVLQFDPTGITPGMVVCSGLNTWLVRLVDTSTKTLTVIQYEGSVSVNASVNDIAYVAPKITDYYIFEEIKSAIRSLSSPSNGLYKIGSWTTAVDPTYQTYTIPGSAAGMTRLLAVRALEPGSSDTWQEIPGRHVKWVPEQGTIQLSVDVWPGGDIEFIYQSPFTVPSSLSDDLVTTVGLPATAVDLPVLAVLASVYRMQEGRRLQVTAQADPRRAEEVNPSTNLTLARSYSRDLAERIAEERARLTAKHPYVR